MSGAEGTARRSRFYVSASVWDACLTPAEISVYAYLSWCCSSSGNCFPSHADVALHCGASVSTVRRSIKKLEDKGLLTVQARILPTKQGKRRRVSNLYTLHAPRHCDTGDASVGTEAPFQKNEQKKYMYNCGSQPPAPYEGARRGKTDAAEDIDKVLREAAEQIRQRSIEAKREHERFEEIRLNGVLDNLNLHLYEDREFAEAVEMTVKDMWHASSVTIHGDPVPQKLVRERLQKLNTDCIDLVYDNLGDPERLKSGRKYLAVCLYNAPSECRSFLAAFRSQRRDWDK